MVIRKKAKKLYVTRCNTFLHSVLLCAYTDYYDHCDYYDDGNFFRKSVSFPIQGSLCHMYFVCMFDVVWLLSSCLTTYPLLLYKGHTDSAHGHTHPHTYKETCTFTWNFLNVVFFTSRFTSYYHRTLQLQPFFLLCLYLDRITLVLYKKCTYTYLAVWYTGV